MALRATPSKGKDQAPEDKVPEKLSTVKELTIKNFRAIGPTGVTIKFDNIIILIGKNDVGKSTILDAYEMICNSHKSAGKLSIADCHLHKEENFPVFELVSQHFEPERLGKEWKNEIGDGVVLVKEKIFWPTVGQGPKVVGYNFEKDQWDPDGRRPWGFASLANSKKRAIPYRFRAFDDPASTPKEARKLIEKSIQDYVSRLLHSDTGDNTIIEELSNKIAELQQKIIDETAEPVQKFEREFSLILEKVFKGYTVRSQIDYPNSSEYFDYLLKGKSTFLVGDTPTFLTEIEKMGSGAQRVILWVILQAIQQILEANSAASQGNFLLLDEPEMCLHPEVARYARDILYNFAEKEGWQVLITTHSPLFIDLSKDNTSIVRIEKGIKGDVFSQNTYRPTNKLLSDDEKDLLKLLNTFDPYVSEFLFSPKTILVEGDTEYSVFSKILANQGRNDIHIVRARGKWILIPLMKILNAFEARYAVLHDSDYQDGSNVWTANTRIRETLGGNAKAVTSITNFEKALGISSSGSDKPFKAVEAIIADETKFKIATQLLAFLAFESEALPEGWVENSSDEALLLAVKSRP